jgi:hypothetical protein
MKLRVVTITKHFNGTTVDQAERILEGESQKSVNKNNARRLLARHYPGKRIPMIGAYEEPYKWCAFIEKFDSNLWRYVYVTPID